MAASSRGSAGGRPGGPGRGQGRGTPSRSRGTDSGAGRGSGSRDGGSGGRASGGRDGGSGGRASGGRAAASEAAQVAVAPEVPLVVAMAAAVAAQPGAVPQLAMVLTVVVPLAAMPSAGTPAEPVAAARVLAPDHRQLAAHIAELADREMKLARPGVAAPAMAGADPLQLVVARAGAAA